MSNLFSNREISTAIWLTVAFLFSLKKAEIRRCYRTVLKSFFRMKILFYLVSFLLYFSTVIYVFYHFEYWDWSSLKDSILWYLVSAVPLAFAITQNVDDGFWKDLVINQLKALAIIQFMIGLVSFALIYEFLLTPIVVVVTLFGAVSEKNESGVPLKMVCDTVLGVIGLVLIAATTVQIVKDYNEYLTFDTLHQFLRPILYTISFLPFLYFYACYSIYDDLFIRLKYGKKPWIIVFEAKLTVFWLCGFSMRKLKIARNQNTYNLISIRTVSDIRSMKKTYKDSFRRGRSGTLQDSLES